jgi:hypothetical protein
MKLFSTNYIVIYLISSACAYALNASQTACQPLVFKAIARALTPRPPVPLFPTNTQYAVTTTKQEQEKESKKRHEYIQLPREYKVINYTLSGRCMFIIAKHEESAQAHVYAVLVYDREKQKCIAQAIHPSEITNLAIHPAGTYFATISKTVSTDDRMQITNTNTVAVWETETGKPRKTWYHLKDVSWIRFMQDKDGISFGGNTNPQESLPNTPRA